MPHPTGHISCWWNDNPTARQRLNFGENLVEETHHVMREIQRLRDDLERFQVDKHMNRHTIATYRRRRESFYAWYHIQGLHTQFQDAKDRFLYGGPGPRQRQGSMGMNGSTWVKELTWVRESTRVKKPTRVNEWWRKKNPATESRDVKIEMA